MRTTTDYVTNVMAAVAATASKNAATAGEAAMSTQQLALGMSEIEGTARALHDRAEQLAGLVATFVTEQAAAASAPAWDKRRTPDVVVLR